MRLAVIGVGAILVLFAGVVWAYAGEPAHSGQA